jgi:hypothetical protein
LVSEISLTKPEVVHRKIKGQNPLGVLVAEMIAFFVGLKLLIAWDTKLLRSLSMENPKQ